MGVMGQEARVLGWESMVLYAFLVSMHETSCVKATLGSVWVGGMGCHGSMLRNGHENSACSRSASTKAAMVCGMGVLTVATTTTTLTCPQRD